LSVLDERKSKENLRTGFPKDRKPYTSHYDYEDDSDLEEDDDDILDSDDELATTVTPQVASEKPENDPQFVTVESSDVKNNESPDIMSVSDLDSLFSESSDTVTKGETDPAPPAHLGKVVVIEDVAFVT
jgi:hypothetical protein